MSVNDPDHRFWMSRCLNLAAQGRGHVSPNPMVGAVLVHQGRILSEGYHAELGGPHAEVQAMSRVSDPDLLAGSTLYVNLEPCNHHGKTPPCTDRILEYGIPEVVIGSLDPNPAVAGNGVKRLQEAGVKVTSGVLAAADHRLNHRFHAFHAQHMPYVMLKWAESADGYIADDNRISGWISNVYSRILVHKWRAQEDAIMVGSQTAIADNPQLNARLWKGSNPLRILLDPELVAPGEIHLLNDGLPTWVLNKHKDDLTENVEYLKVSSEEQEWLPFLLNTLAYRGYQALMVEGGGMLLDTFIRHGQWHEARVFKGTRHLGGGIPAPQLQGKKDRQVFIGNDLLQYWFNT